MSNKMTLEKINAFLRRREVLTFGILIAIWVILSLFNENYATLNNLCTIMRTLSFFGIIAVGLSLVLVQGDKDMSTGGSAGFSAVFGTAMMLNTRCMGMQDTPREWLGVLICVLITMCVGMLIGALTATLVVTMNLPPFIATTAMRYILQECIMIVTAGAYVYPLPASFNALNNVGIPLGKAKISLYFLIMLVFLVILGVVMIRTKYGRSIYAVGSNRISAQLAGINTTRVRYTNYIILHALCALSGMLNASYITQGSPNIGRDWELTAVAACAMGGISMKGGSGNMVGLLIGLFALFSINSAIAYIGINTFLQDVVIGVVLLAIVVLEQVQSKRKIKA